MAKTRSPGYPAIGLKEAVEKVRGVYEADYQNAIPRAVAAAHMGYKSLNGKSLGVLSALVKYGLLEGRGDNTRVTDLAVQIIAHPAGTSERIAALKEAAEKPELFVEIEGRYPGGKTSDQAIRSYLMTQKFIPAAADAAIRAYRETNQLVETESRGYSQGPDDDAARQAIDVMPGSSISQPRRMNAVPQGGFNSPPLLPLTEAAAGSTVTPIRVSFNGDELEIVARIVDAKGVDRLIKILQANKPLLGNPIAHHHADDLPNNLATEGAADNDGV